MRRVLTVCSLMLAVMLVAVACGETRDTGFPPPEQTNGGGEDNGENGGGGAFETPPPQDAPAEELTIQALNITFNREQMRLVADTQVTLTFENLDSAIPHNVAIYQEESASQEIFVGETFNGVETRDYTIPPTPAGEYFFRCDVHPNMNGVALFE